MPCRNESFNELFSARRIGLVLCAAVGLVAAALPLRGAENEVARVKTDEALVYHGADGYPTSELAAGSLVAVLQTKGEWVAIKPPPGSFSWVSGQYVAVPSDEGGLARVSGDDVKVYVGTIFEQDRLGWQVKLKHGEAVEIRGKRPTQGRDGEEEMLYKISPPRSEVRWMKAEDLDRGEAIEVVGTPGVPGKPVPPAVTSEPEKDEFHQVQAAAYNEGLGSGANRNGPGGSGIQLESIKSGLPQPPDRLASRTDNAPSSPPPSGGWRVARSRPLSDFRGASSPGGAPASLPRGGTPYNAPPAAFTTQPAGTEFSDRLEWLELELARIATKEPKEWNFTLVRQESAKLIDAGTTAVERGRARLLLEKIDQFDEVRGRYEKLAAQQATGGGTSPVAAPAPTGAPAAGAPALLTSVPGLPASPVGTGVADPAAATGPIPGDYAGKGYLMPIVSARKNVPRFALTDDKGEILQFVTPAPGVNLNQYLRRPVGLSGRSGFLAELGKPHITAERVIDLDRQLR